jgi:hypothetical protein
VPSFPLMMLMPIWFALYEIVTTSPGCGAPNR